jgi:hypothetical protein
MTSPADVMLFLKCILNLFGPDLIVLNVKLFSLNHVTFRETYIIMISVFGKICSFLLTCFNYIPNSFYNSNVFIRVSILKEKTRLE